MTSWVAKLGDRSLFPELSCGVYTHHAAIAPVSVAVEAAVARVLKRYATLGAGAFVEYLAQRGQLRGKLETLIGAEPDSVALELNTSRGVSDIALSIPWRAGDRVVVLRGEFPANVTPWQRAAELFRLGLVWHDAALFLSQPEVALQQLERDLKSGVRLVAVSAVQFQTGLCMPLDALGELCEQHNAELFVDGIQACGVVPLNVQKGRIHYLAGGGHKWLMGMEGAGFVYVAPHCAQALRPHTASWLSHEQAEDFLLQGQGLLRYDKPLKDTALVLESGTQNVLGCAALEAALDLLQQLSVPTIFAHVQQYLDRLEAELVRRGFSSQRAECLSGRSGILSVLPPANVPLRAVHQGLVDRGVVCGMPDGFLRFSPHWPNALGEVDVIAQAIDEILKQV